MRQERCNRLPAAAAAMLSILLVAACTSPGRWGGTEPTAPAPTGAAAGAPGTIADSEIGDQLTVTAALVTIISERSFVVGDVDLPDRGLLALGPVPDHARPADLLTIRGVIDTFEFNRLAAAHGLVPDDRYDSFLGAKVLVTSDVRSWA